MGCKTNISKTGMLLCLALLLGNLTPAVAQEKEKKAEKQPKIKPVKTKKEKKGFLIFGKKEKEAAPEETGAEKRARKKQERQARRTERADVQAERERACALDPNCRELKKPAKAAAMALTFPGLGQVYNRKYWKLPLVYGLLGTTGYFINFYHNEWVAARNNLSYLTDNDPDTILEPDFQRFEGNVDALRRERDNTRRDRDYSIILMMIFYGLTVADATVDAHLSKFDISEDLTVKLKPAAQQFMGQPVAGASIVFSFNQKPKTNFKKLGR